MICSRCARPCPFDFDDLDVVESDPGGDPDLPVVFVPPVGWISCPDGEGVICGPCASVEEISSYMAALAQIEAELGFRERP